MCVDIVIIGAGPAGASAALTFARQGRYSVLVIDKTAIPRDKPCGGAMPGAVESLLSLDLSEIVANRTTRLQLYHNYKQSIMYHTEGNQAPLLVHRRLFDAFLLRQAQNRFDGLMLKTGAEVRIIEEENNGINVVLKDGSRIQSRYVIGADGALGRTAESVGLMGDRRFAQSLEAEVIMKADAYRQFHNTMVMNYFCIPKGYGWIFPKDNAILSCGIGTWGSPINIRHYLDDFLLRSLPKEAIEAISVKGHPIPVYRGRRPIATKRVLLTGDAAALVDPISGEGIRYALHSGKIAAESISAVLEGDCSPNSIAQSYQERIESEIGMVLKRRLSFVSLAFHHQPDLFYQTYAKQLY